MTTAENKKNVLVVENWKIVKEIKTTKKCHLETYCRILNDEIFLPVESHFLHFTKSFPRVPIEEIRQVWNDLPLQDVSIIFQ